MAVFIELTSDSFTDTFNAQRDAAQKARRAGVDRVRRPLRGLEVREDTYAIIKVVQADGSEIPLIDSGSASGTSTQYANFLLQSVKEARMEKHQIVETFGEPYIFFFGESPRFLDVTAVLVDSGDFNWYAEFWENYNRYLRGTRLVEMGARTYLFYDDNIVEGYMLLAQAQKSSTAPLMAQLTFRLYLTNYSNVSFVGDPNFPVRSSVNLPGVDLTTADAFTAGKAGVTAAAQDALNQSRALTAATGAQQQASGFGGGRSLSDALRSGVTSTGDPFVDATLQNAMDALRTDAGSQARTAPLRGKIADNLDEFTALIPPPPDDMPANSSFDQEEDQAGQPDTQDLHAAAVQQMAKHGADINNPDTFSKLGMSPNFTTGNGFGLGNSSGSTASFGVQNGSSFGGGFGGGLNGGLGFTGSFASASLSPPSTTTTSTTVIASVNVFGNGVPVQQGVSQGTGIGGGIPGGISGGVGPGGPGTLSLATGGLVFTTGTGFSSSQGYGQGLSSNGAAVNVGGTPSLFALVSTPGTLNPAGSNTESFFIGLGGNSSQNNALGVFV